MKRVGFSKITKRVYVDEIDNDKVMALQNKGYEVYPLGGKPVYFAHKTSHGLCSGPTAYSARHCFGTPLDNIKNRKYEIVGHGVEGAVVKDYSPPLWNIFVQIARFFGGGYGVRDVVRVSTPLYPTDGQVAVVTGGVLAQPIGLFAPVLGVEPEDVVDSNVIVHVDVPETDEIQCHIFDYAIIDIFIDKLPWPHELLVAKCKKHLRPGNSGGPVYLE